MTILMNKFHSSKEKNTFFEKIKSESIYHQDKRNPNCLWLFWRQLVMNQSKTRFHRARRSPFVFGINKVAARKSTRKITGKNLNAKLIKKETNLNLKHCLVKVQSLNLTFIYLQGQRRYMFGIFKQETGMINKVLKRETKRKCSEISLFGIYKKIFNYVYFNILSLSLSYIF